MLVLHRLLHLVLGALSTINVIEPAPVSTNIYWHFTFSASHIHHTLRKLFLPLAHSSRPIVYGGSVQSLQTKRHIQKKKTKLNSSGISYWVSRAINTTAPESCTDSCAKQCQNIGKRNEKKKTIKKYDIGTGTLSIILQKYRVYRCVFRGNVNFWPPYALVW